MFKSTKEFDSAMKNILEKVRDGESLNSLQVDDDSLEAIAECITRGFLQGIEYERTASGKPCFQIVNLRVSYNGLKFIESNS